MDATVVRNNITAGSLGRSEQPALQGGVVAGLYSRPVKAGSGRQPDILGHDALGNAERSGDLFMRQPGILLQTKNVSDLTHRNSLHGHAVSRQKAGSVPARFVLCATPSHCRTAPNWPRDRRFRYRDRRFRQHHEIGHDGPELPVTINRNQRSRSSGITGHDAPEYPAGIEMVHMFAWGNYTAPWAKPRPLPNNPMGWLFKPVA